MKLYKRSFKANFTRIFLAMACFYPRWNWNYGIFQDYSYITRLNVSKKPYFFQSKYCQMNRLSLNTV